MASMKKDADREKNNILSINLLIIDFDLIIIRRSRPRRNLVSRSIFIHNLAQLECKR